MPAPGIPAGAAAADAFAEGELAVVGGWWIAPGAASAWATFISFLLLFTWAICRLGS